jgi:CheY-like chemotaxis protein
VLLVGGHEESRDVLTRLLRYAGAFVTAAPTANEARAALRIVLPHVLIVDIGLPEAADLGLLAGLRATPTPRELPAVALTGRGTLEVRRRAMQAGFQALLLPPVDPDVLCRLILALARRTAP